MAWEAQQEGTGTEGRECCVSTNGADQGGDGLPAVSQLPKLSPIVLGQLGLRALIRDTRGRASRHTRHSVPPCSTMPTKAHQGATEDT